MDRANALRRIHACLRLAASSNPHESASALRQAKALMLQFGVGHAEAMNVDEAEAPTRARGAEVPKSILLLATICAKGFGARCIHVQMDGRTVIRFYGIDGVADVAAYAFTVLRRQVDADRLKHVSRVRKRARREERGENFAYAWVIAIRQLFPDAETNAAHVALLEETLRFRYPNMTKSKGGRDLTTRGKTGTRLTESDWLAGFAKGLDVKFYPGIQGAAAPTSTNDQLMLEFHS